MKPFITPVLGRYSRCSRPARMCVSVDDRVATGSAASFERAHYHWSFANFNRHANADRPHNVSAVGTPTEPHETLLRVLSIFSMRAPSWRARWENFAK